MALTKEQLEVRKGPHDEEWKPIPGYPLHLVSSHGRVFFDKFGGRFLKPKINSGYERVELSQSGHQRKFAVHQLVLLAHLGTCPDGMQTRHLDGNKRNNMLENLTWGTSKENQADKRRHGTWQEYENSGNVKLTWRKVAEIRRIYLRGDRTYGSVSLGKKYCVSRNNIGRIVRYETWV